MTLPGRTGFEPDDESDHAVLHGDATRLANRSAERDAMIAELKRATGRSWVRMVAFIWPTNCLSLTRRRR